MGREWIPFVEWGYLLQVTSLAVALVLGVLLLMVPCSVTRARPGLREAALFFALGVAYLFVELWAIYKLDYLVSYPMLASALALTAMLAASGAGALVLVPNRQARRFPVLTVGVICLALLMAVALFSSLSALVFPHNNLWRSIAGVLWIGVPAFFMGFPFPVALERLARREVIPWALALNGLGSVLGSLLATLVAVHFGLTALAVVGAGLYGVVGCLLPKAKA